jgi:hypothetical protein
MSFDSDKFSKDKFFVCHFTYKDRLRSIVENYALVPPKVLKRIYEVENPGEEWEGSWYMNLAEERETGNMNKYMKSIFYSILFPDNNGDTMFKPVNTLAYFIFSPKIIQDNAAMVGHRDVTEGPIFCNGWNFGNTSEEECIHYNTSKSLEENLHIFRDKVSTMIDIYSKYNYTEKVFQSEGVPNCELLMEGEMPIELDLLHIYVPRQNFNLEKMNKNNIFYKAYLGLKEQDESIDKLIEEYPHLPWTRENPFKKI